MAYEGLKRVRDNKWKVTISLSSQLENEEDRKECNSSYAFFKEKIIKLPNSAGAQRISCKIICQ